MNSGSRVDSNLQKKPRVVEIIGPAGVGKTTLFQALKKYQGQILLGDFPNVRKIVNAPFFIRYGLQLFPTLLRLPKKNSRKLSRREFAWMSVLTGWPFVLQNELKKSAKVIVLDQGPVYLLAEMREFGPEYLKSKQAEKFWWELFSQWAGILDMIVWLDAQDLDLMERIRTREQEHVVKNEPPLKVFEFLARYRKAFDYVLSMLEADSSGLRILRFDTSVQNPREIEDRLLAELYLP
jgi:hypothetical protein